MLSRFLVFLFFPSLRGHSGELDRLHPFLEACQCRSTLRISRLCAHVMRPRELEDCMCFKTRLVILKTSFSRIQRSLRVSSTARQ